MPTGIPTKYKECSICHKLFLPKCPSQRICEEDHYVACPICNTPMVWNTTRVPEPCSKACKKMKLRQFYLQKYGTEHPMQSDAVQNKFKETMLARYGVEHALQNEEIQQKAIETNQKNFGYKWVLQSPEVRKKITDTMLEKYGVDCGFHIPRFAEKSEQSCLTKYGVKHAVQAPEIQDKIKQTMIMRYGVDNALKIPEVKLRVQQKRAEHMESIVANIRQTFMANYGVPNCFQSEEIKAKIVHTCINKYGVAHAMQNAEIKNKVRQTIEERYGVPWYILSEEYRNNGDMISKINRAFGDALKQAKIPYKFEHRIGDFSYDIRILNAPILIEIDPTYTHNIIGCHWKPGLSPSYHKDKMLVANNQGFQCVNVFDWDNWERIIPMLSTNKERIEASALDIYILSENAAKNFLSQFSLQGIFNKPAWHIGLVNQDEIYQLITLSVPRYNKKYEAEIVRWQSNPKYEVIGGYDRLLNFVLSDDFYAISSVVLYFDNAKPLDLDILNSLKYVQDSPPTLIWSKGNRYVTDRMFKRFGYKGLHTETELLDNGWLPIYNCGYKVYERQHPSKEKP